MGKASRRQRGTDTASRQSRPTPAPFERRPFEGLAGETDWVALREILPAATAVVTVRPEHVPDGAPSEVTVATVLPMAWPGLHRADGTVLIGTQSGNASGDASRDLAGQLLEVDTANYAELAQPRLPNRGVLPRPAQVAATSNDVRTV